MKLKEAALGALIALGACEHDPGERTKRPDASANAISDAGRRPNPHRDGDKEFLPDGSTCADTNRVDWSGLNTCYNICIEYYRTACVAAVDPSNGAPIATDRPLADGRAYCKKPNCP